MTEHERRVEAFYAECGNLLGVPHEFNELPRVLLHRNTHKTRWNGRSPGNGRFPGCGLIRVHGNQVSIMLRRPISMSGWFDTMEDAIAALRKGIGDDQDAGTTG